MPGFFLARIRKFSLKIIARVKLDPSERLYVTMFNAWLQSTEVPEKPTKTQSVLFQIPVDYYYACLFLSAKLNFRKTKAVNFFGLWHYNIVLTPRDENFQILRRWGRHLFNLLDRLKWTKIHDIPKFEETFSLAVGFFDRLRNWATAYTLWKSLISKQDVLNINHKGTYCGDLIYDTYLRYRVQPTVDIDDPYLCYVIRQCLNAQTASRNFFNRHGIDVFISSYASYVQHGIPIREALQQGIYVYTAGSFSQYFKKLSLTDTTHTPAHWLYREMFSEIPDKNKARAAAKTELERRFNGSLDRATAFMKGSAFAANDIAMPQGIDGVLFLHDFFDNPHCYRDLLFEDFWEWTVFTIEVIRRHKLNIAVKPHPNQLPESIMVVTALKNLFPDIHWLDTRISNGTIFKSGIRCGISVFGTVLHELAYHGIPALAAGDHPHIAFDIAITPKTRDEYEQCLINYKMLTLPDNAKEQVLNFYYMHIIHNKEEPDISIDDYDFRKIARQNVSLSLEKFATECSVYSTS